MGIPPAISLKDASTRDVDELARIKEPASLHVDRLSSAESRDFRYLVAQRDELVVGFACLVFKRPANWSDADDRTRLPQIVDMMIATEQRGQGYGSAFLRKLEEICVNQGHERIYLAVDPVGNPRAHSLYRRLGYEQIQPTPYQASWHLTDSAGNSYRGTNWTVDMVKRIG